MNFLVSANHQTVLQFQTAMAEHGEVEWLIQLSDLLEHPALASSVLIVIDVAVPGYDSQLLSRIKQLNPAVRLLLAGVHLPPEQELAALAAGANGCLSPDLGEEQVRRILSLVEGGGVWISNAALPKLLQRLHSLRDAVSMPSPAAAQAVPNPQSAAGSMAGLTQREQEIACMVAAGNSNKVIARKLAISDRTVKAHLTTIFQKLNVHDRLQLALRVNKMGGSV